MSVRLRGLVAAERIRLLSLRSTRVFLAGSVVIAAAAACLLCVKVNIRPEYRASYPSLNNVFNAGTGSLLMAIAGCFGAATMTSEYSSGLIRVTFSAVPGRGRVMLAKALAVAAVAGVAGVVATIAVIVAGQVILGPGHYQAPLSQPGGPRAAVAFTLLMPLAAITGLALGALLRRPATAVAAVVIVLNLLPALAGPAARHLTAYGAWTVLANQPDPGAPASAAMSWIALCAWPATALTLALVLVRRRDL